MRVKAGLTALITLGRPFELKMFSFCVLSHGSSSSDDVSDSFMNDFTDSRGRVNGGTDTGEESEEMGLAGDSFEEQYSDTVEELCEDSGDEQYLHSPYLTASLKHSTRNVLPTELSPQAMDSAEQRTDLVVQPGLRLPLKGTVETLVSQ